MSMYIVLYLSFCVSPCSRWVHAMNMDPSLGWLATRPLLSSSGQRVWCDGNLNNWIINMVVGACSPPFVLPTVCTGRKNEVSIKSVHIKRISWVTTPSYTRSTWFQRAIISVLLSSLVPSVRSSSSSRNIIGHYSQSLRNIFGCSSGQTRQKWPLLAHLITYACDRRQRWRFISLKEQPSQPLDQPVRPTDLTMNCNEQW